MNGPATKSWEVISPSSQALDLRNHESVRSFVQDWKPAAIIHTAYRRDDPASIVDASRNIAEAAVRYGARLVHLSTDALFAGRLTAYREIDEPTPVHDYGRWKAEAELVVATTSPAAVIVRTSLLYGRTELSVHELAVREVISGRSNMRFFTDEFRSPVVVDDLALAVAELAGRDDLAGRLHLGGPEPLSRADLAIRTARRHGWDESKLRFSTIEESGLHRPGKVVLDSSLAASYGLTVNAPPS